MVKFCAGNTVVSTIFPGYSQLNCILGVDSEGAPWVKDGKVFAIHSMEMGIFSLAKPNPQILQKLVEELSQKTFNLQATTTQANQAVDNYLLVAGSPYVSVETLRFSSSAPIKNSVRFTMKNSAGSAIKTDVVAANGNNTVSWNIPRQSHGKYTVEVYPVGELVAHTQTFVIEYLWYEIPPIQPCISPDTYCPVGQTYK